MKKENTYTGGRGNTVIDYVIGNEGDEGESRKIEDQGSNRFGSLSSDMLYKRSMQRRKKGENEAEEQERSVE